METQPHILLCLTIVDIDDQVPQDLKVLSSKSMVPTKRKHTMCRIWFRSDSSFRLCPPLKKTRVQIPASWV